MYIGYMDMGLANVIKIRPHKVNFLFRDLQTTMQQKWVLNLRCKSSVQKLEWCEATGCRLCKYCGCVLIADLHKSHNSDSHTE